VIGGSPVVFNLQTPYEPKCSISVSEYAIGDGVDEAIVTITLKDQDNVAVPDYTPVISESGTQSTVSVCTISNSLGVSTCKVKGTTIETVNIGVTTPSFTASFNDTVTFTEKAFTYTWKTDQGDTDPDTKKTAVLPLDAAGVYNFVAYWGDGTFNVITNAADPDRIHTYSSPGTYTIELSPIVTGQMSKLKFITAPQKLMSVTQWGTNVWTDLTAMFKNAISLSTISATDSPVIGPSISMESMFEGASSFNSDINHWNTANVTSFKALFKGAVNFDQPLDNWETHNVTNMSEMFSSNTIYEVGPAPDFTPSYAVDALFPKTYPKMKFNRPLPTNGNKWKTEKVTTMSKMFAGASLFNQDISLWDTRNVASMSFMFFDAAAFDQDISKSGSLWDTSKVVSFEGMFQGATNFDGNISNWDTRLNASLRRTFAYARKFNQNIQNWDTSDVSTLSETFYMASFFNQPLTVTPGGWNTSTVSNMYRTFAYTVEFNQDISTWDTHLVTGGGFVSMFLGAKKFNNGDAPGDSTKPLSQIGNKWEMSGVTSLAFMFHSAESFNQDISSWTTTSVLNMESMFYNSKMFNKNISSWDTSNVTDMNSMFQGASEFNQPLISTPGQWNTSNVLKMNNMFYGASKFNQNLNSWDVSKVETISGMFCTALLFNNGSPSGVSNNFTWILPALTGTGLSSTFYSAVSFNGNLNTWITTNVTSLNRTFINASKFNQPLSHWNVSKVTSLERTFEDALLFNQDISGWNTGLVTNMYNTFQNAQEFNQNLNGWNTSSVTKMQGTFMYAKKFKSAIFNWNTSNVTNMSYMFYGATLFDNGGALNMHWNTSKVTNMSFMFTSAVNFNSDILTWNTSLVTNMSYMFYNARLFNKPIAPWDTSKVTNMNNMFQGASVFEMNISNWNVSRVNANHSNFDTSTSVDWITAFKPLFPIAAGSTPLKLFVTDTLYDGNLGGITEADLKCASDSNNPGMGTYKAFLGVPLTRGHSPEFDWVLGPSKVYQRTDSVTVTTTSASKNFSSITSPFELSGDVFWTGIDSASWSTSSDHCDGWTSNLASKSGTVSSVSAWNSSLETCDQLKPILCIEQ
jgi:surface protein